MQTCTCWGMKELWTWDVASHQLDASHMVCANARGKIITDSGIITGCDGPTSSSQGIELLMDMESYHRSVLISSVSKLNEVVACNFSDKRISQLGSHERCFICELCTPAFASSLGTAVRCTFRMACTLSGWIRAFSSSLQSSEWWASFLEPKSWASPYRYI